MKLYCPVSSSTVTMLKKYGGIVEYRQGINLETEAIHFHLGNILPVHETFIDNKS